MAFERKKQEKERERATYTMYLPMEFLKSSILSLTSKNTLATFQLNNYGTSHQKGYYKFISIYSKSGCIPKKKNNHDIHD